jgi:hypothetical protein
MKAQHNKIMIPANDCFIVDLFRFKRYQDKINSYSNYYKLTKHQ